MTRWGKYPNVFCKFESKQSLTHVCAWVMVCLTDDHTMIKIYTVTGEVRRQSKNLRAIQVQNTWVFSKSAYMGEICKISLEKNNEAGLLYIAWPNGDYCNANFESYKVMCGFVHGNKYLKLATIEYIG